ncbi:MAG: hypothetical protein B7Y59_07160 [Burkholderiales bacterium 35-55-47]|uniref:hypothetical protein n=1 Tax=Limnohabitans sp. TaxID=1907725 RepID=UPI000BDAD883|nr:hypothetical protein [Limnohabitans sp.]OYY18866.1 MAG: hypothetical protein B7Y59_07160 [Burkholderiales bacterium 35-55-47]OYZ73685.1 MAG: hypothetical protein B7Y06_06590 [Burkholderiales bacterium 24-55-52]OZB00830.1 MAG: hypothetical protein B7X62_06605 [Burkholderiales bacterium 39-55-53]HQR85402.1 hypothetical protein [Limnohabitans sp.]HQS26681.1 hypothetical protein [Limnohabitans sp.]
MTFIKQLFGISDSNHGEILTKVSVKTWVSTNGDVINQVSDDVSVSTKGTVYTRVSDNTVVGSDGSLFTSLGDSMSSDGSIRTGDIATGRGALFNDDSDW